MAYSRDDLKIALGLLVDVRFAETTKERHVNNLPENWEVGPSPLAKAIDEVVVAIVGELSDGRPDSQLQYKESLVRVLIPIIETAV